MICGLCDEHITNPIAPERMATQIKTWLEQENLPLNAVDSMLQSLAAFPKEEMCIITKEAMGICPHCFAMHLKSNLKLSKVLSEDFDRQFTFHVFPQEIEGYSS